MFRPGYERKSHTCSEDVEMEYVALEMLVIYAQPCIPTLSLFPCTQGTVLIEYFIRSDVTTQDTLL